MLKPRAVGKRAVFGATVLAIGLTAVGVHALDNVHMYGSHALSPVMDEIMNNCPGASAHGLVFLANTTAREAGQAMIDGRQTVAPMTRAPISGEICSVNGGVTAEALVVGLEAGVVVSGAAEAQQCGSDLAHSPARSFSVVDGSGNPVINCTGCDPGTNRYPIDSWRDVLAMVYGGLHHSGGVIDCNGPVRRSLVANWGNLFEQACSGAPCPQGLRRAFRTADMDQTTETFISLVGLPLMPPRQFDPGAAARDNPFCNAHGKGRIFGGDADYMDEDPIRVPCADDDQVCGFTVPGRTGTLGLVLAVPVPSDFTQAQAYPTRLCDVGKFRFGAPQTFGGPTTCPNGLPKVFNKCFQPVAMNPDGSWDSNCIARKFPVQGLGGNGMDGRTYNLFAKSGLNSVSYLASNEGRSVTGAFFRLHTTRTRTGAAPCTSNTSSRQVACLAVAHGCSLGQAQLTAVDGVPGAVSLAINGVPADHGHVQNLVGTPGLDDDYPLARRLYFASLRGFEDTSLQTGELELARCMANSPLVAHVMGSHGFVPVPGAVRCVDLASDACPASESDACANNPAGLLSP